MSNLGDIALVESKISKAIHTEFVCKKENLLYTLGEIWKDCISVMQDEGLCIKNYFQT